MQQETLSNPLAPKVAIYSSVAMASGIWLKIPMASKFLFTFVVVDFLTGLIAGFIQGKISSEVGYKGAAKKVLIFLLVYAANQASKALNIGFDLGSAVAVAYSINELISIVENCAHAGVPIPSVLVQALAKVKQTARSATAEELKQLDTQN